MTDNTISFEEYHLPGLQSGPAKLQSRLDITLTAVSDHFVSPELTVQISGPRFNFSPAQIKAIFPPRDSLGEWDNVLAHIELMPSTLPWQRKSGSDDKTVVPWLALILLQETEWLDKDKVNADESAKSQPPPVLLEKMPWEELRNQLGLPTEVTDRPADEGKSFPPVQALRIERAFLEKIMPPVSDLRWLTHVRCGHDAQGEEVERAIVACNRMALKGARASVHLVSLEGRLNRDGSFNFNMTTDGRVALLSLHSWQFTCPTDEQFKVSDKAIVQLDETLRGQVEKKFPPGEARDVLYRGRDAFMAALEAGGFKNAGEDALVNACHIQSETFKGLMDSLDFGWLQVPKPERTNKLFEVGSVPVAHGLGDGHKTVSWYHGPLIADANLDASVEETLMSRLPVRNAEQLMLYDQTSQMRDASYSAAWELGRLLSISEQRVSQEIAQWKTSHAREAALVEQNMWFTHIPFTDSEFAHREGGLIEQKLQKYFSDLSRLQAIPFQYLIPHESLLPDESLRFFYVDQLWVECLLDGAFSIGRTTRFDLQRERAAQGQAMFPHQQERPLMTGVMLRSDLVSGWPSLLVDGYQGTETSTDNKLELLRYERLGLNVAIAIFGGKLETFALHLPPESLHFGFSRDASSEGGYFKEVKNLADGNELPRHDGQARKTSIDFSWRDGAETLRILVPQRLVENINSRLSDEEKQENDKLKRQSGQEAGEIELLKVTHSGHLALQLLEGVPRLQVTIKKS